MTNQAKTASQPDLRFTGNWYIDLGILGTIFLIENKFGYNLEKVINIWNKEPEKFNKIFTISFLHEVINKNNEEISRGMDNVLQELRNREDFKDLTINDIWDKYFETYKNILKTEVKKLPLSRAEFRDLWIFNAPTIEKQKELWDKILNNNFPDISREQAFLDKTINKLLPSYKEFENAYFVPLYLRDLSFFNYSFLSLREAFVDISIKGVIKHYCFYSPDLEFSYVVNRKLKEYKKKIKEDSEILKVTWKALIDVLYLFKSEWVLSNMYLISYERMDNKKVENVEYIGIDRQKAKIIIDDEFREKLNTVLQYSRAKTNKNKQLIRKWLLMEYLENNSLFDICWEYVKYSIENNNLYLEPIFYALMIEANSRRYNKVNNGCSAFDYIFHHSLPDNSLIKEGIRKTKRANDNFNKIKSIERHIYYLLLQLKETKKNSFVNNLLKIINSSEIDHYTKRSLIDYIFNRILYNNSSNWKHYGLALILPQKHGK
jgi:hypothetical protein